MIFDYFKKRREARAAEIRAQEERIRETTRKQREAARQIVDSQTRTRSTTRSSYTDDTPYIAPSYSSYSSSSWSDSSSSSSYDSGSSSSCDSGGGGGGGCD